MIHTSQYINRYSCGTHPRTTEVVPYGRGLLGQGGLKRCPYRPMRRPDVMIVRPRTITPPYGGNCFWREASRAPLDCCSKMSAGLQSTGLANELFLADPRKTTRERA